MSAPPAGTGWTWRRAVLGTCLALGFLLFASIEGRRPWQELQLDYLRLQEEHLGASLELEEERLAPELDALRREVVSKEAAWSAQQHEVEELQSQRRALDHKRSMAQRRLESSRRALEQAARRSSNLPEGLEEQRQAMHFDRREVEELTHQIEDRQTKIDALRSDLTAAEDALALAERPLDDLRRQLREVSLAPWSSWPMWAPWSPALRVREQQPEVLAPTRPPSVERCTTCHLGVLDDEAASASRQPVLRSHPRPDLYLQPESAHPLEAFGCRVCHGGDGRATGGRKAKAWGAEGDPHHGLVPKPLLGAACRACHGSVDGAKIDLGVTRSDGKEDNVAVRLAKGTEQLDLLGCGNCHVGPSSGPSAPDLTRLANKTSKRWVYGWLLDPSPGHPKLSTEAPESLQVEALAISESLWQRTRTESYPAPPGADGDAGAALFETLGCRGCHAAEHQDGIGPSLDDGGRELDSGWIYAWLRQPFQIDPETTMPDFRLSSDEAAQLTAFLIRGVAKASPAEDLPVLDPSLRDRLLLAAFGESMTLRESQARVDALGDRQRTLALGDHLLTSLGCFGCHRGGDAAKPAANLRGLDLASGHQLARSHVPELAVALDALLGAEGERSFTDVAGAGPRYDLEPATGSLLLTALLEPPAQVQEAYRPTPLPVIERGEQLVTRYGCRGCHRLGGRGGNAFASKNPLQRPPDLDGIGRRLRADWLQSYLEDPGRITVRPWLQARMPSYGLSAEEVLDLVAFFLARDGASALHPSPEVPRRQDLTVGSLVFEALQCDRCHFAVEDSGGFVLEELAPDYRLASQRLRPDWVVQWLLDPQGERPRTTMPSFLGDAGQGDLGYLSRTFDSPLFLVHRQRLRRQFEDLEAMEAYLLDQHRVATALRDHVWSLGETSEMR